jgi:hypothetical protein
MKKILTLSVLLFAVFIMNAQEPMFVKDDKVVNLGVGLGGYGLLSGMGVVSIDYCIVDGIADVGSIGVGPYAGLGIYNRYSWGYSRAFSAVVKAGARGTFHYPFVESLDTYAGFGMGLGFRTYSNTLYIDPGFFIGARYLFSDKLSFFGELGYGVSNLIIGVSFKF